MTVHLPTSQILHDLVGDAPADSVTLDWLMGRLGDRSFGVVLLLLALVGVLQGVSVFAGVLLTMPAFQMIMARPSPVLPSGIAPPPHRHAATRPPSALDRPGAAPPGKNHPSALARSDQGDETRRRRRRAVTGSLSAGSCPSQQCPACAPDPPDCLSLPAGGWRCCFVPRCWEPCWCLQPLQLPSGKRCAQQRSRSTSIIRARRQQQRCCG